MTNTIRLSFPAGSTCTMSDNGYGVGADIEGVMDDGRIIVRLTHVSRPDGTLQVGDRLGVPFDRIIAWAG